MILSLTCPSPVPQGNMIHFHQFNETSDGLPDSYDAIAVLYPAQQFGSEGVSKDKVRIIAVATDNV